MLVPAFLFSEGFHKSKPLLPEVQENHPCPLCPFFHLHPEYEITSSFMNAMTKKMWITFQSQHPEESIY